MAKITGYLRVESNGAGLIIDASMCTESELVKPNGSAGEYACDASHCVVDALSSSVRTTLPAEDQRSTCSGWRTDDQRSMNHCAFGDMSMPCVPAVVVRRRCPVPSKRIS